jgi:transposase-like protein
MLETGLFRREADMRIKRHSPEQILNKLRQVEVAVADGKSVGQAVRGFGVTDHTYYRWRREYNTIRPHSSLGYRPPVPETIMPRLQLVSNPR